ncbi:SNF2 family N-terminal domain-containing protein [Daldinia bambusicola]|nr:SNF2 family N-terminal domain-containing protein [Daldinia bambusicola]
MGVLWFEQQTEDGDRTYMEPPTPGVKRPWEAVSPQGEFDNDSTALCIYSHKKIRTNPSLDIPNGLHAFNSDDATVVEPTPSNPAMLLDTPPPLLTNMEHSQYEITGCTERPYQDIAEHGQGDHYVGIEENTASCQYLYAHNGGNKIGSKIYGASSFADEIHLQPENETLNNALSSKYSLVHRRTIENDSSMTMESPEGPSYDTCFGVLILEDLQLKARLVKGSRAKDVKLEVNDTEVIVWDKKSVSYLGLLGQASTQVLVKLTKSYNIELKASLKTSKIIEVIIYGQFEQGDAIGNTLLDHDYFLQQPDFYDASRPYKNPQCLSYDEKEKETFQEDVESPPSRHTILDETGKNKADELLDYASGPINFRRGQAPRGITTELKPYQIQALTMMMEKESGDIRTAEFPSVWVENIDAVPSFPRFYNTVTHTYVSQKPKLCLGGLLADEMGLGKTLTTLALIAGSLNSDNDSSSSQRSRKSLVVCPVSTIDSWQGQIEEHFKKRSLTYSTYHGSARGKAVANLERVDIVLTTYETLRAELLGESSSMKQPGLLCSIDWHRVILDEAHMVRNRASKTFQAVRMLKAKHRWCLTATPIQNRLEDLGALVEFLRIYPFDDPSVFKHTFLAPINQGQQSGWERLRSLIKSIALRRTKASVTSELELPPRTDLIHDVRLNDEEQTLYNSVKRKFALAIESGGTTMNTFQFILRLRQICNHGGDLLPGDLQDWLQSATCSQLQRCEICSITLDHGDELSCQVFSCFHQVCWACLQSNSVCDDSGLPTCPLCNNTSLEEDQNMNAMRYNPSSKVKALLQNLHNDHKTSTESNQPPLKSIVFSAWTGMLDRIGRALSENSFTYQRLDGSMNLAQRCYALEEFRTKPNCIILLASLGSAAVGLNLTIASRVHLMEPGWNPLIEQQAIGRVHRLGQKNEVIARRYIVSGSDSIEQYIKKRQSWKTNLIMSSLGDPKTTRAVLQDLECAILSKRG